MAERDDLQLHFATKTPACWDTPGTWGVHIGFVADAHESDSHERKPEPMSLKTTILTLASAAAALAVTAEAAQRGERPEPPRTREEAIERAIERFDRMDEDGDGYITIDDLGEGRRAKMMKRRLKNQDTDEDGRISQAEVTEHAGDRFDELDLDGNGELSDEELEAAQERGRGRAKGRRG
ncbi:MAG: EF-hand domain-containing protein [Pseudomonadota bacterium]